MTREEAIEQMVNCAQLAQEAARREREASSQAWSRAGMLFARIAELTAPSPRPPVSDQIMGGPPTRPVVRFGRVVPDTPDTVA